jgi:hypothetical protein
MRSEANHPTRCQWLFFSLVVCAYFAGGCNLGPVNTPAFSDESEVRRIDPNNGPFTAGEIQRVDAKTGQSQLIRQIKWKPPQISHDSGTPQSFSVKYDAWQFRLTGRILVPIDMSGCKRSAIVDTGFSGHVYMNDLMVESCNLAVFPLNTNPATGSAVGLCDIPALRLGPMVLAHPPCLYEQMQWQFRVLGIPLYRHKIVLLGLDFMRPFSYVLLDNTRHTIAFSPRAAFEPDKPSDWLRLPFALEKVDDNLRMMMDFPVGGNKVRVEFDTGGARPGLTLREAAWTRVASSVRARATGAGHCQSYQYGPTPCRKYSIPQLNVGRMELKDAAVDVLPDSHPLLKDLDGILSLDYFRTTVVVMDFKKSLIWIRQP